MSEEGQDVARVDFTRLAAQAHRRKPGRSGVSLINAGVASGGLTQCIDFRSSVSSLSVEQYQGFKADDITAENLRAAHKDSSIPMVRMRSSEPRNVSKAPSSPRAAAMALAAEYSFPSQTSSSPASVPVNTLAAPERRSVDAPSTSNGGGSESDPDDCSSIASSGRGSVNPLGASYLTEDLEDVSVL